MLLLDAIGELSVGLSCVDSPRLLINELNGQDKWLKTRLDRTGATDDSVLCSLYFTKDSYETSVLLSEEMGLPARKDSAVPTLFPKANAIRTGSME